MRDILVPGFTCQPAGAEACAVMAALHDAAFTAAESWSAGALASLMVVPGTIAILAVLDGQTEPLPAGFILARIVHDEAEILTIAVHPRHRRQGIGLALLQAATQMCEGRGVAQMFLEVSVRNTSAAALYASSGFVPVGLRRDYYCDGSDARVLVKAIAA